MEDTLASKSLKRKRSGDERITSTGFEAESTSDSDSEDEDDVGALATKALDSEIFATLDAIRSKDPRVYDKKSTFYTQIQDGRREQDDRTTVKQEKPMFLRDYHRENLVNGVKDDFDETQEAPLTYNQEQEALKRSIVGEINAAKAAGSADSATDGDTGSGSDGDGFLVAKMRKSERIEQPRLDVENADRDPETFLSNFMAARAWVPSQRSQFQPFESDDEEEDRKAEEFEEAYNFRFEDPGKSNEKLVSHARDIAAKYSVRREEKNTRKKQRDVEREKKDALKLERAYDKARLRKLKIEEAEEKLRTIKAAAGLKGSDTLLQEDWAKFLDDDWDDAKWEEEMQQRFGEAYYAQDEVSADQDGLALAKKKRKPKKPTWEDDLEIKDLIPDFGDGNPIFEVSDETGEEDDGQLLEVNGHRESAEDKRKNQQNKKKDARKERRIIEQLVDDQLEVNAALEGNHKSSNGFRYRETSPLSFGLSAQDILMADDTQLNEYAGLKKLASFRDPNKKRKDQKHLGKKARLRQWRRDTFGNEEGPLLPRGIAPGEDGGNPATKEANGTKADVEVGTGSTKKKRRHSKKKKKNSEQEVVV